MHKFKPLILFIVFFAIGCSSQDLSKQEYYEKGIEFLNGGNSNGSIIAFKKAIEMDQNFFEARYQLASAYMLSKKYESAERELLKALRLNPSLNEAHLALAKAYVNMGKNEDAIKEVDLYLNNGKDDPEAFDLVASAYAAKRDYTKAEKLLNKSLAMSPDRVSSKILLAMIYIENGEISRAENLLNEILKSDSVNKDALFLLASIKRKRGEVDDLIKIYQRILDNSPDDIRAKYELGLSYLQQNKFEESMEIAEALKESYHKRPEGFYLMGLVDFQTKRIDEAIISLKEALRIAAIPGANYYLGLSQLAKGNLEQATNEFQRVIDIQPDMIQARLMLAVTHFRNGRLEDARRRTVEVLNINEENAFAHNLLGSIYMALGNGELAMNEFDLAIELDPKLVDAHIKKGAFSLLTGDAKKAEEEFLSAVEIAPNLLNSRIILARYYLKKERFKDAIEILQQGLNGEGNDSILYNSIGVANLGMQNTDIAIEYFEKAIKHNPKFFLPYHNLAMIYLNKKEKDKAVAEYERVLGIDSDNLSALLMLAKIMEGDSREKEALAFYKRAIAQRKPEAYIRFAEYYYRKSDHNKAIQILEEALRFNPKDVQVMDMQGRIYTAKQNYKSALEIYKAVADVSPEMGALRLAGVYSVMNDYDRAIKELKRYMAGRSERLEIRGQIVNLLLKKKEFQKAEQYAREIVSLNIDNYRAYQILASVYYADRKFQKAIDTLETADTLNPDNLETKIRLGKSYLASEDFPKALKVFEKIEKSYPNYTPVYFLEANTFELLGKRNSAVEKYKKLLKAVPDNILALNNLAYLYAEGYGPVEKAVDMAQRAKKLAPKDGRVTDTLGWTLFKKGKYDEALEYFLEAVQYLPDEPTIRYHLGLAYIKKGMNAMAEEHLKNAIDLGRSHAFEEIRDAELLVKNLMVKK